MIAAFFVTGEEENVPPSQPSQQSTKKRGKLFHKPSSLTALLSSGKSVSHLLRVCFPFVFLVLKYHLRTTGADQGRLHKRFKNITEFAKILLVL